MIPKGIVLIPCGRDQFFPLKSRLSLDRSEITGGFSVITLHVVDRETWIGECCCGGEMGTVYGLQARNHEFTLMVENSLS